MIHVIYAFLVFSVQAFTRESASKASHNLINRGYLSRMSFGIPSSWPDRNQLNDIAAMCCISFEFGQPNMERQYIPSLMSAMFKLSPLTKGLAPLRSSTFSKPAKNLGKPSSAAVFRMASFLSASFSRMVGAMRLVIISSTTSRTSSCFKASMGSEGYMLASRPAYFSRLLTNVSARHQHMQESSEAERERRRREEEKMNATHALLWVYCLPSMVNTGTLPKMQLGLWFGHSVPGNRLSSYSTPPMSRARRIGPARGPSKSKYCTKTDR